MDNVRYPTTRPTHPTLHRKEIGRTLTWVIWLRCNGERRLRDCCAYVAAGRRTTSCPRQEGFQEGSSHRLLR